MLETLHHHFLFGLGLLESNLVEVSACGILSGHTLIPCFVTINSIHFILLIQILQPELAIFLSLKSLLIPIHKLVMYSILLIKTTFPLLSDVLIYILVWWEYHRFHLIVLVTSVHFHIVILFSLLILIILLLQPEL